jgi:hypothetical protein
LKCIVEGRKEIFIFDADEVEQARYLFGPSLLGFTRLVHKPLLLVQTEKGGVADSGLLEEFDTGLGCLDCVYHDVIERPATS